MRSKHLIRSPLMTLWLASALADGPAVAESGPPFDPKDCDGCEYSHEEMGSSADGGHCSMFRQRPTRRCQQRKPADV